MQVVSSASAQYTNSAPQGGEVLAANLAKKQQVAEGQMALQLLDSAQVASTPASSTLGVNVNIRV